VLRDRDQIRAFFPLNGWRGQTASFPSLNTNVLLETGLFSGIAKKSGHHVRLWVFHCGNFLSPLVFSVYQQDLVFDGEEETSAFATLRLSLIFLGNSLVIADFFLLTVESAPSH